MKRVVFLFMLCSMVSVEAQTVIASWSFSDSSMTGVTTYNETYYNSTAYQYVFGRNFMRMTDSLMGDNNDGYMYLPMYGVSGTGRHHAYLQLPPVSIPENNDRIEIRFRQKYQKRYDYCFVEYYYNNSWQSIEINQDIQRDSIGPDSMAIVLPPQASQGDSLMIRFQSAMYGWSGLSGYYYWAIDDVEIITPPDLSLYQISATCGASANTSVEVENTSICNGDTDIYENSRVRVTFTPNIGYETQAVFMNGVDITSALQSNTSIDHIFRYSYIIPSLNSNLTFLVNTITMPNVNISVDYSGTVIGVEINGNPVTTGSVLIPYGSHDTIIIHTQPGSLKPTVIEDSAGTQWVSKINDSTYKCIIYCNRNSAHYSINAQLMPVLTIVNDGGGYIYWRRNSAQVYDGQGLFYSDTAITYPSLDNGNYYTSLLEFATFLPDNTIVNELGLAIDTNAYRLTELYIDGVSIDYNTSSLIEIYDYSASYDDRYILYRLLLTMETGHSVRAVYRNYNVRFDATVQPNDSLYGVVTGSGNYLVGTELTISAIANYGYHFDHWSDGNTDNPRTLTLNSDTTLIAFFMPNSYHVYTACNDDAMGTVSGGGFYDYNTTQMIVAEPTVGNHFVRWTDGNIDNPRFILIERDTTFTAIFGIDTLSVNVSSNNIAYGNVIGGGEYTYGSPCSIEATAYSGYLFVRWSNGVTYNPYTFAVLTNMDIVAIFAPEGLIHNITVQVQPAGAGTVTGDGPYADGETATLEAVANEGWHFERWNDNNTNNPRTVIVTADISLTAHFASDNPQGIEDNIIEGITIWTVKGNIYVKGAGEETVHVFDIMGRPVGNRSLPAGVYMVKVGSYPARKVVVIR